MTAPPLVTIGMAVYNGARFLQEALTSAFRQTYPAIEVLLYNDGSTDATLEVVHGCDDPRLVIIDGGRNSGVATARQVIKTLARGAYLSWLDADDRFLPERVDRLVAHALQTGADLVCDSYRCLDEGGQPTDGLLATPDYIAADPHFTRLFERNRMMPHPLIHRRCFNSVDYDLELPTSEDYDYWLKCSWQGFTFARMETIGLEYRIAAGSLSSNHARSRTFTRQILEKYPVDAIVRLYSERGFDESTIKSMACLQHIFRQQYPEALAYALQPWGETEGLDRAFYLGTLALQQRDLETALPALEEHLGRCPNSPAGLNNLGVAHRRLGQKGTLWFARALAAFPGYQDAQDNLTEPDSERITLSQLATGRLR